MMMVVNMGFILTEKKTDGTAFAIKRANKIKMSESGFAGLNDYQDLFFNHC